MAQFTVTIDTDNDAFQPNPVPEISRILTDVAKSLQDWEGDDDTALLERDHGRIRDISGNTVGRWTYR